MKLFCRLFGHQPPVYAKKGWWSPGEEYGRLHGGPVDGIGSEHGHITAKCARCGEQFTVARVHLIKREAEKALEKELEETMLEVESWKLAKQATEQMYEAKVLAAVGLRLRQRMDMLSPGPYRAGHAGCLKIVHEFSHSIRRQAKEDT